MKKSNNNSFYIATKFENIAAFYETSLALKDLGFKLSLDWTKHKACKPYSEFSDISRSQSNEDLSAIDNSDFIVFLQSEIKATGAYLEIGYALAKNKPIYCIGSSTKDLSMFFHLHNVKHFNSLDKFLNYIKGEKNDINIKR